jgi:hypothetical protein
MKNADDPLGNRTRDLPACSAVPQPIVPSHAPLNMWRYFDYFHKTQFHLMLSCSVKNELLLVCLDPRGGPIKTRLSRHAYDNLRTVHCHEIVYWVIL